MEPTKRTRFLLCGRFIRNAPTQKGSEMTPDCATYYDYKEHSFAPHALEIKNRTTICNAWTFIAFHSSTRFHPACSVDTKPLFLMITESPDSFRSKSLRVVFVNFPVKPLYSSKLQHLAVLSVTFALITLLFQRVVFLFTPCIVDLFLIIKSFYKF